MYDKLHRWSSTVSQHCKTLWASFYSSHLYVDAIKRWHGLGVSYFLFLIILGTVPFSCRVSIEFNDFFKERILLPIESIPLLTIQNGELICNEQMPYLIKNNNGEVVSIIDTTGTISSMDQAYPQLTTLITKNKIDFRPPNYKQFLGLTKDSVNNPIYTRTFDKELNGYFSTKEWLRSSGISKLKTVMQILIFPLVTSFYFVFFGAALILLSSATQLYSDIFFNRKLAFKASCRLLSVAVTPALLLFFLIKCSHLALPYIDYIVITLTYVSYGLFSVKRFCV